MSKTASELKLNTSPVKLDPIHSNSDGRFVEPKLFVGFQNQGLRLTVSRPQSLASKFSRISSRQYEHFLPDHLDSRARPRFGLFGEQFFNPNAELKESPMLNSSRNNDTKSSRITRSINASPSLGSDFVLEPIVRSQGETRLSPRKAPTGGSVLHPIPLELLTKHRRSNASPSDGSSRTRSRPKKSQSFNSPSRSKKSESVQNSFRSSTIHIDGSELPWK